jgi:hypothetical protein
VWCTTSCRVFTAMGSQETWQPTMGGGVCSMHQGLPATQSGTCTTAAAMACRASGSHQKRAALSRLMMGGWRGMQQHWRGWL